MDEFKNTNVSAGNLWNMVEKKLTEDEKVEFHLQITSLIKSVITDIHNDTTKNMNRMDGIASRMYGYVPQPKQDLDKVEKKVYEMVSEQASMAYEVNEITVNVARMLCTTKKAAADYIRQLEHKGYFQRIDTIDGVGKNKRKVTQFEILK